METPVPAGRYQPLADTAPRNRPEQARWADAMKRELARTRMSQQELTARVAGELGLADGSDKIRRWLANDTQVNPHAIPVLARAVGVHPLAMLEAYELVERPCRRWRCGWRRASAGSSGSGRCWPSSTGPAAARCSPRRRCGTAGGRRASCRTGAAGACATTLRTMSSWPASTVCSTGTRRR